MTKRFVSRYQEHTTNIKFSWIDEVYRLVSIGKMNQEWTDILTKNKTWESQARRLVK